MADYVSVLDKDDPDYKRYHGKHQGDIDWFRDLLFPTVDTLYGGGRALVQNTGAALRAGGGFAADVLSGEGFSEATRTADRFMEENVYSEEGSTIRAQDRARGAEAALFPMVALEKLLMKGGKWVEETTDSELAGAITYGLAPNFIPLRYLFSKKPWKHLKGDDWIDPKGSIISTDAPPMTLDPSIAIGKGIASRMPIDLRPHGHDWFSRLYKTITGGEGYYSHIPGDRAKAVVEAVLQTMRGYIKGEFLPSSPYYQAIKKKHGVSAGDLTQIEMSLKSLYKPDGTPKNVKPKTQKFHQNLIASQLRKVFALRLKEGLPISDELFEALKAFHPRMAAIQGAPNVEQLAELTGKEINPQIAQHLIDGWAHNSKIRPDDASIYTAGENPGKILEPHGHIAAITKGGGGYDTMGKVWADLMSKGIEVNAANLIPIFAEKRAKAMWKSGHAKFTEGDPIIFDGELIKQDVLVKMPKRGRANDYAAYAKMKGKWKPRKKNFQEHYNVGVPNNVRDVMVDGEHHILYHTNRLTADQLLAGVPMEVVLNPRTGQSWMLAADEMDIAAGKARTFLERPYKKRFWTVFQTTRFHNRPELKRAGVEEGPKYKQAETTPFDWEEDVMGPLTRIRKTTPGTLGWVGRKALLPVTGPQAREEERKRGLLSAY